VLVGSIRPPGVDQVDGLDADQPVVPPEFGEELALEDFAERLREALQFEPVLLWDLEEVESAGLESN
jgi:hypothetical protein